MILCTLIGLACFSIGEFTQPEAVHSERQFCCQREDAMQVILVHGAFQGGWVWDKIAPRLRATGYEVFCPTLAGLGERYSELNPDIGLGDHIHDVCQVIDANALDHVVLIGHSYGGMVVSGVAKQRSNKMSHIFYLDAPIPENNESLLDVLGSEVAMIFYTSAVEQGEGWRVSPFSPEAFGLTTEEGIAWAIPKHTSQSLKTFTDPVSVLAEGEGPHISRGYIQCIPGNSFTNKQVSRALAKGWQIYQIESQHCPMVTDPDLLVDLIDRLMIPNT